MPESTTHPEPLTLTATEKRKFRAIADYAGSNLPVVVVPGRARPKFAGESAHYETKTGVRIAHPSAYAKKGRSTMCYVASTRRIVVGRGWVLARRRPVFAAASEAL